jgi:hypothetical protein
MQDNAGLSKRRKEREMKPNIRIVVLIALLAVIASGAVAAISVFGGTAAEANTEVIEFEVAENTTKFVFDEAPVHEDGLPAYGNSFITQGYIYPEGTLNGSNGVLPDGSPEFPEEVIGEWICRGWFIGDGAHTTAGPIVITTQTYQFGEEYGNATIVSDGYELAEVSKEVKRAITGGTGQYQMARGEVTQELLGFTEQTGVNLRFTVEAKLKP